MSLKALHLHGKHQCTRPNCLGHPKDYNNYLHAINFKPKKKISKTARSLNSLHDKTKQNKAKDHNQSKQSKSKHEQVEKNEIEQLKHKNNELTDLLQEKSRKINDLKARIKEYESRFKQYDSKIINLQNIVNEQEHPKSPTTLDKPSESMMHHYQQQLKMLQNNQKTIIDSIEKYRTLQKQYHEYRYESENTLKKLQLQISTLRQYTPNDKSKYDEEITSLRHEIYKLSEFHQQSPISHKGQEIENEYLFLKISNKQLLIQKENLLYRLKERQQRQRQLRCNLQVINKKVQRWSVDYQLMVDDKRELVQRYEELLRKCQLKKDKHIRQKQEWANIFHDLMRQVEKLKRQINRYEKSTNKLVQMYTQSSH